MDEFEIKWRRHIKYLGVELDGRLNFHHHMPTASNKAIECAANLARVMLNVGGAREKKRRVVASVAHAKLLYAAPALVEKWQERWYNEVKGRWTYRLIPTLATWLGKNHGEVSYYLTQALTGHGCFNLYLQRFKKKETEECAYCQFPVDKAEHTLFACSRWDLERQAMFTGVNSTVAPENMVALMIQFLENWRFIETFIITVMMRKDLDGRRKAMFAGMDEVALQQSRSATFKGKSLHDSTEGG
ncbi:uncharacterized protein LOC127279714 [Leptopilina boulardi]|uniref:uncharacterized protein LOC127279714 n=1 Tax=Leptopilina boulardi TaxID=63433 RepID=UPI0021F6824B|nr:uncharacterized protein LOC127279714 [Leptopilina boulardi]